MVLARNPHFHPEFYPSEGMLGDRRKGYLQAEGKRLPLVDRFVFTLEKKVSPVGTNFCRVTMTDRASVLTILIK